MAKDINWGRSFDGYLIGKSGRKHGMERLRIEKK